MFARWLRVAVLAGAVGLCAGAAAADDLDLYMLRLVNRARSDPAGEAARIGSGIVDNRDPVPPLAYELNVAQAAANHNDWMHDNLDAIANSDWPDSFTHYETLNGLSGGTPATGTPSYTGVNVGGRLEYAGFSWSWAGENISTMVANYPLPVDVDQTEENHLGWWESGGHRDNMLRAEYTVFGYHAETRTITPGAGNIPPQYDRLHYGTQDYARPWYDSPPTYILGLLYADRNGSGGWEPRADGDPFREGLGGAAFEVRSGATVIVSGATMANGAFSANVGDGTYDLVFTGPGVPNGLLTIVGVTVAGANIDAGDFDAASVPTPASQWLADRAAPAAWLDAGNWTTGTPTGAAPAMVDNGGTAVIAAQAAASRLHVGHFNSGTVQQTGGAATFAQTLHVGHQPGSNGTYELSGGSLQAGEVYVGGEAAGSVGLLHINGAAASANATCLKVRDGGTVHLSAGTFTAETIAADHGTFDFDGGTLHVGQFLGDLTNAGGTLGPGSSAGLTRVEGDYAQSAGGTLDIELGGSDNSDPQHPRYDTLEVTGQVTLAGGLSLTWVPVPGDESSKFGGLYDVLTYAGGRTGELSLSTNIGAGYFDPSPAAGVEYDDANGAVRVHLHPLINGDADLDADVDYEDYKKVLLNFGQPDRTWWQADFDLDGDVDYEDYKKILLNFGSAWTDGKPPTPIPEPATLLLLALGGVAGLLRRRS